MREDQLRKYREDGFCLGDEVLSAPEVEELRSELLRVIEDRGKAGPQPVHLANLSRDPSTEVWQIVNIWQASEPFEKLLTNPRIAAAAAALSDAAELRIWHDQIQYKPAATGGVNMWHQDSPYWPCLQPKTAQVTAWIALDDVDEENGCMWMVPGSQKWGVQIEFLHTLKKFDEMPDAWEGRPVQKRACPVKKGLIHFHHPLTWHGSNANRSGRPRRAIALHFMTGETRYEPERPHVMERFIESTPGNKVEGKVFPVVWTRPAAAIG
jgi:phytanoyl-CoA hydroxylase